jgi:Transglutaminase-like superfamily
VVYGDSSQAHGHSRPATNASIRQIFFLGKYFLQSDNSSLTINEHFALQQKKMINTSNGQNGASVAANSRQTERSLLAHTNDELKLVDPLVMNLLVAKGIPSLAKLNIFSYEQKLLEWSNAIRRGLRDAEHEFRKTPWDWKNDLAFFRLGYLCYYVDEVLGIRYRDDQKNLKTVHYSDPTDLFLNGVIDTKQGTCANMAALHVALGWRLKWPVSLACVGSHLICRYDDGKVTHNIEATKMGDRGFHSHPDEYYLTEHRLPGKAITCGSDLRAVTPMEMLGIFFGLRARFFDDTGCPERSEPDYLLARSLFPRNRYLHFAQMTGSVQLGMHLFEHGERGHPVEFSAWLQEYIGVQPLLRGPCANQEETTHACDYSEYTYDESGRVE